MHEENFFNITTRQEYGSKVVHHKNESRSEGTEE